ncbi:MFS transporter, DHA2 family, multidrug resistance protein [Consotaella salsifontis]|uniref:MFS transporter, DHA2 family, multidrug resistance protein n=1 Tax=Consotaella salsifontis TaxID=1365950 RepID=A0A1T4S130_9HYPH|nr:MFS transporter, DHA2 family, multidrug resistance protein [Consotaella salsifontis]
MSKENAGSGNPWLIAIVVSIATFMEVLDTTIANVALRYISGGLAISADEASWVVTTYLVSNAIVLTASSFIAKRYGRKSFYLGCLALFTVASILCGMAWSLSSLLFFRVLQGFAGGGMVPISQSILADSFPPEKRGQGFAMFGIAVVVAPVIGPTLGGWLSDNYSWHWCFLINGPVGVLAFSLVYFLVKESEEVRKERQRLRSQHVRFDLVGFLLVAGFLGSLEVVLDRGQTDDWFSSTFIIAVAAICALCFLAMIPWEATRDNPVIDVRMVASRQFGSCFVVMMATGAILIATTQFLPELLQEYYGYTATWAGLALSPGGLVTMMMMFIVGRLTGIIQPRYLIAAGASIIALAMWDLTRIYADLNFGFFVWSRVYIGLGLPLIFIPITTASYFGIPPDKTDQASALINVARNVGGSDRRVHRAEHPRLPRAVPPQSPDRAHLAVEPRLSATAFGSDGAFRSAGFIAGRRWKSGSRGDRPGAVGPGRVPRLYRRLLRADGDLGADGAARPHPSHRAARQGRSRRPLTPAAPDHWPGRSSAGRSSAAG